MRAIRVFKFGGASVKDAMAVRRVADILKSYREEPLLIVASAMGKTTNALEQVVEVYFNGKGNAFELLEAVKKQHFSIAEELFPLSHPVFAQLNDAFIEIEWVIEDEVQDSYDYLYDQIVSMGEILSTRILSAFLEMQGLPTRWLDVRDYVLTDDSFRAARVNWEESEKRIQTSIPEFLSQPGFVLTQGFLGGTPENFTTTLGREGSDYSAAIFAYCLNAASVSIWKDVPGILTADPRLFSQAEKIDRLSYREAIEMTYYGAKVIHPKTIKPLQNKGIPLYVKSFVDPQSSGTLIAGEDELDYPPMIIVAKRQSLLKISTRDFSFIAEHHLSRLFNLLSAHRIKVNMMRNSAISFSVCLGRTSRRLDSVVEKLNKEFHIERWDDLELLTVRHYKEELLPTLINSRKIYLEERNRTTVQMVLG